MKFNILPTSSFEEINLKVICAVAYKYYGIPHSGIIISSIATGLSLCIQFLHLVHGDIVSIVKPRHINIFDVI